MLPTFAVVSFSLLSLAQHSPMPLTQGTEAVCRIVTVANCPADRLINMAVESIVDPVQRWSDVRLAAAHVDPDASTTDATTAFKSPAIVLSTVEQLRRVAPTAIAKNGYLDRAEFLGEQGFICLPVRYQEVSLLLVVGQTTRGVYNGAVYVSEFCIDGPAGGLTVDMNETVRTLHLHRKPVYVLSIWGEEDEYTVDDWKTVFDSFARDGATDIYFWLSGHFPSKEFPHTYKLKNREWDSTEDTAIGTLDDQRRLIQYAHKLGMRFYVGGGLGGWSGTYMLTKRAPGTMRENSIDEAGNDVSNWSLCPASQQARDALVTYYKEMFDSLPEADGLYIESADELGECRCERCRQPVDSYRSRMFGQYQLSLMQRMMREIWRDHPHARLCYTIGYSPHEKNPAYYEVIRQMSADDRIEWMEARNSWTFPGPGGEPLPVSYFSNRVLRWDYSDVQPLEPLISNIWQAATSGMGGCISTFSPGFASGSFYHDVPFPTDRLPYVLTHFVHREAVWQPTPHVDQMKERVRDRFFGADAPKELTEHLWNLREILRQTSGMQINEQQLKTLAHIRKAVETARDTAHPKADETLDLMSHAIDDIHRLCGK